MLITQARRKWCGEVFMKYFVFDVNSVIKILFFYLFENTGS